MNDERCPECGCEERDDTVHRDGCPRVNTCGQFGPPWMPGPWHPFSDFMPYRDTRRDDESLADFEQRYDREFTEPLHEHLRKVHGR